MSPTFATLPSVDRRFGWACPGSRNFWGDLVYLPRLRVVSGCSRERRELPEREARGILPALCCMAGSCQSWLFGSRDRLVGRWPGNNEAITWYNLLLFRSQNLGAPLRAFVTRARMLQEGNFRLNPFRAKVIPWHGYRARRANEHH